jgi:hypothetical protein
MYGVFIDVTERKKAEEAREMLAGEMDHRVKNIFAITSALTTISDRSTMTKDEMAKDLRQRIVALSNAHNMVRPDHSQQHKAAQLGDLLAALLEPYSNKHLNSQQVHISTPIILVGREIRCGTRVGRARVGYKLHQIWGAIECKRIARSRMQGRGWRSRSCLDRKWRPVYFETGGTVRIWYQARYSQSGGSAWRHDSGELARDRRDNHPKNE